jgi:hypothetical protein
VASVRACFLGIVGTRQQHAALNLKLRADAQAQRQLGNATVRWRVRGCYRCPPGGPNPRRDRVSRARTSRLEADLPRLTLLGLPTDNSPGGTIVRFNRAAQRREREYATSPGVCTRWGADGVPVWRTTVPVFGNPPTPSYCPTLFPTNSPPPLWSGP